MQRAEEEAIHKRLLEGDVTAPAELADTHLRIMLTHLRIRFRGVQDETLLQDAAADALLDYIEHPSRFDPQKSSLSSYLKMSAEGDLRNALDREARRRRHLQPLAGVELFLPDRNNALEGIEDRLDAETPGETRQALMVRIRQEFPDARDWNLVTLMMDGVRRTSAFAEVLEIGHLGDIERQRIVKQHKDRLKKRLERLGVKIHAK